MTPIDKLPPPVQQWEGPVRPKHRRLMRDLYKLLVQSVWALIRHEGLELSGYMAFTCILSLFPFLIFLASLAGFVGEADSANRTIDLIFEFMPHAVAQALTPIITEVLTQQHGGLLTFGIVFTLWTASSGIEALRTLLNRSYGVTETRPIWYLRPQSVLMVIIGAVVMTLLSIGIVLGPLISSAVQHFTFVPTANIVLWILLRYAVAAVTISGFLIALHLILPNQRQKLRTVWPGSAVTTLLWLAMASLFSLYLDNSSSYSITYGSLGGIIISLMFFYLSAIIFAFGAEINATLRRNFS